MKRLIKKIANVNICSPLAEQMIYLSAGDPVDNLYNVYVKDISGKMIHLYDYYLEKYGD